MRVERGKREGANYRNQGRLAVVMTKSKRDVREEDNKEIKSQSSEAWWERSESSKYLDTMGYYESFSKREND